MVGKGGLIAVYGLSGFGSLGGDSGGTCTTGMVGVGRSIDGGGLIICGGIDGVGRSTGGDGCIIIDGIGRFVGSSGSNNSGEFVTSSNSNSTRIGGVADGKTVSFCKMTLACDGDTVTISAEHCWLAVRGRATVFEFSHELFGTSTRILFSEFGDKSELDVRSLLLLSFNTIEESSVCGLSVAFLCVFSATKSLKSLENSNCI